MNEVLNSIAEFMCMAYDAEGLHSIPDLRWKLWSKKNKEAENLPPTEATFIPLIQRSNHVGHTQIQILSSHLLMKMDGPMTLKLIPHHLYIVCYLQPPTMC